MLQEREFERIGDTHTTKVDVRVVAATNSDLQKMVADGAFREDLFYRLNIIPIQLPPLRERKEDIPLLVQHFLKKFSVPESGAGVPKLGQSPERRGSEARTLSISQQAHACLMAYAWPGNVRQLENAIERAVALSGGRVQIETADLTADIQQASTGAAAPDSTSLKTGSISNAISAASSTTDPSCAREDRRQQRSGIEAAQPQADNPGRETQAVGTPPSRSHARTRRPVPSEAKHYRSRIGKRCSPRCTSPRETFHRSGGLWSAPVFATTPGMSC